MPFIDLSTIPPQQIFPGVQIRAPYGQNLMLSVVDLNPNPKSRCTATPTNRRESCSKDAWS